MAQEIAKPQTIQHWIARNQDGSVLHTGYITPEQVVTTGQPVLDASDSESELLGELAAFTASFPELPAQGTQLDQGDIYRFGDVLYMVRQSHVRTEHDPSTILALFLTFNAGGTDWVAGEQVQVGTLRNHNGSQWRAIQAHVTQAGWEPANVPALWAAVVQEPEPEEIPDWVQPTGAQDAYPLGARVRFNGQVWENTGSAANVWQPGVFGWVVVT